MLLTLILRHLTLVGEKGVTLSGGRRDGLARAAYARADLVLLGDPHLLDPEVSKKIVDDLIVHLQVLADYFLRRSC